MKQINDKVYFTAEETAGHLVISEDEFWGLTLESARPGYVFDESEIFYLASDVERLRATAR